MKKILLLLALILGTTFILQAQTSVELLGKWKLVAWKNKSGKEKDIRKFYKTDEVYQVFKEDGKFESVIGDKVHSGKWKLAEDNKALIITVVIAVTRFEIDFFDAKKRIISSEYGVFEYEKQD